MTDVLLIGSSIFRHWGDGAAEAFPGRSFVNIAVGGTISADWVPDTGTQHLRAMLVEYHPAVVGCYVGSNDINHGIEAGAIADNVLSIADAVTAAGAWFAYFSIIKCPDKRDKLANIDAVHEGITAGLIRRPNCSIVDINPVFDGRDDFFQEDGTHLTPDAYTALTKHLKRVNIYEPTGPA
ncbi:MAG: GDSL-type esterase/lipase family protein [Planctomycetota bacterium]